MKKNRDNRDLFLLLMFLLVILSAIFMGMLLSGCETSKPVANIPKQDSTIVVVFEIIDTAFVTIQHLEGQTWVDDTTVRQRFDSVRLLQKGKMYGIKVLLNKRYTYSKPIHVK